VPEYRLTKKYFLDWRFDKARADIREFGSPPNTRWRVAGIPLVLYRRLGVWTLRWIVAVRSSRRFSRKLRVWGLAGAIVESYRQSRAVKR
jgi:hypothetical protein